MYVSPIFTALFFLGLRALVWVGQALDMLLYPKLRDIKIQSPIVIVGAPRTGSTFLQRFLHLHQLGLGQTVLQQVYPSIFLQKMLSPFTPLLEKISPARHHSSVAHQTSLASIETDDAGIFLRFLDGFFLYGFLLSWAEEDLKYLVDPDNHPTFKRDVDWWEKAWKRNLLQHQQERVLVKSFSLMVNLPQFQKRYPDAKCLVLLRDPLEMVPSALSLVSGVLEKRFRISRLDRDIQERFYQRLSGALLELLEKFVENWNAGRIKKSSVLFVPYPRLISDFENMMEDILLFTCTEKSAELTKIIQQTAQKQKSYQSKHQYSLEQFGLNEALLQEKSSFFYHFMEEQCG